MTSRTDLDGELVVAEHWPIDGPYRAHDLAEAAAAVEQLLRYANHATRNVPGQVLPDPEKAATVIRGLGEALGKVPQLCDQLASCAEVFAADPALRAAEDAPRPAAAQAYLAAEVLRELATATAGLRKLAHAAASPLNTLYLSEDTE